MSLSNELFDDEDFNTLDEFLANYDFSTNTTSTTLNLNTIVQQQQSSSIFTPHNLENEQSRTSRNELPSSISDIDLRIEKQTPQKTLSNAKWACGTFNQWVRERNEHILASNSEALMFLSENGHSSLKDITKANLNSALKFFVFEVRKRNGLKYPSESLRQLINGINYWLRKKEKKNWNIFTDSDFEDARNALDGAMKETAKEGNDEQPKRAVSITEEQEEDLWNRFYLGDDNPKKLNRTLLYLLSKHCGLRGGAELRQLSYGENGNLNLVQYKTNIEILEYYKNTSKTNNHGLKHHHIEPKSVRIWPSENANRCVIRLYKKMINLRPAICNTQALFLQPHPHHTATKWYNPIPMGHNTLSLTIRSLMEAAGFDGNYTNQSGRRTAVTRIIEKTGDKKLAKKISGHRSECIDVYDEVSDKRMRLASNVLSNQVNNSNIECSNTITTITDTVTTNTIEQSVGGPTTLNDLKDFCKELKIAPKRISVHNSDGSSLEMNF